MRNYKSTRIKHLMLSGKIMFCGILIILSSCKYELEKVEYDTFISKEEFIAKLKGEYTVTLIQNSKTNGNVNFRVTLLKDSIVQYYEYGNGNYSLLCKLNDSIICKLPIFENFGVWTIKEINNKLILEERDYCNHLNRYEILINSCNYNGAGITYGDWGWPLGPKSWVFADITLVNENITLISNKFILRNLGSKSSIECDMKVNDYNLYFQLTSK